MQVPRGPRRVERSCTVCRTRRKKAELIRFVRSPSWGAVLDPHRNAEGRGAYTCMDPACIRDGLIKGRVARALRARIPHERAEALAQEALEYLSRRGANVEDQSS